MEKCFLQETQRGAQARAAPIAWWAWVPVARVRRYALWLSEDAPEQRSLRERMRSRLRGRRLVCHCAGKGLPCHAEVIAVVANACVSCEVLAAGGRG